MAFWPARDPFWHVPNPLPPSVCCYLRRGRRYNGEGADGNFLCTWSGRLDLPGGCSSRLPDRADVSFVAVPCAVTELRGHKVPKLLTLAYGSSKPVLRTAYWLAWDLDWQVPIPTAQSVRGCLRRGRSYGQLYRHLVGRTPTSGRMLASSSRSCRRIVRRSTLSGCGATPLRFLVKKPSNIEFNGK